MANQQTETIGWALVTGASSGIGAEFAKQVASRNYDVVLVARRLDRLESLAQEIKSSTGRSVVTVALDLSEPNSVAKLMESLISRSIEIALLFNNAGYGTNGEFCELDLEREVRMVDLNCRSLVALSHWVATTMKRKRRGTILHTASLGGLSPTPFYTTYGATKAFIVSFSEALAEELRPYNVRVYTVCPGVTESEFSATSGFRGKTPPKFGFQTSAEVAREAIRAIGGRTSLVITGRHNRAAAWAMRFIPRSWALRAAGAAMRPISAD